MATRVSSAAQLEGRLRIETQKASLFAVACVDPSRKELHLLNLKDFVCRKDVGNKLTTFDLKTAFRVTRTLLRERSSWKQILLLCYPLNHRLDSSPSRRTPAILTAVTFPNNPSGFYRCAQTLGSPR